ALPGRADRLRSEPLGYGVIGNTADSGSVVLGSSPGTPALTPPLPRGFSFVVAPALARVRPNRRRPSGGTRGSALEGARADAVDDLPLAEEEDDDHRDRRDHACRDDDLPVPFA